MMKNASRPVRSLGKPIITGIFGILFTCFFCAPLSAADFVAPGGILDLETARNTALSSNPDLSVVHQRLIQAAAAVRQARSAYWPSLDTGLSAARVWTAENSRIPGSTMDDPEDYFTADLTASWLVFDGFARKAALEMAACGEMETREALNDAERLLYAAVTASFYGAQLYRENIAIAEADEDFNRRLAEEAGVRRSVGAGSLSTELTFKIQVNSARANVIAMQRDYEAALYGLMALMGVPRCNVPEGLELQKMSPEKPEELEIPSIDELIDLALTRRPDILKDGYSIQRAKAGVRKAEAAFYPTLALSGSIEGRRPEDPGFEGDDIGGQAALALSFRIFDGGLRRSRLQEARAAVSAMEFARKSREAKISEEIRKAVTRLKSAKAQLALQRTNAEMVRRNRDLVKDEYQAGQVSLVRLNEAQRDLIRAQSSLTLALVSLRLARSDLSTALGTAQIK